MELEGRFVKVVDAVRSSTIIAGEDAEFAREWRAIVDEVRPLSAARSKAAPPYLAHVHTEHGLCAEEVAAVEARVRSSPQAGHKRIAVCFSGGGARAMTGTVFALDALKHTKILDAATYVGGLSGSTWAIAPWIAGPANPWTADVADADSSSEPVDPWASELAHAPSHHSAATSVGIGFFQFGHSVAEDISVGIENEVRRVVAAVHDSVLRSAWQSHLDAAGALRGWIALVLDFLRDESAVKFLLAELLEALAPVHGRSQRRRLTMPWFVGAVLGRWLLSGVAKRLGLPPSDTFRIGLSDAMLIAEGRRPFPILVAITRPAGSPAERGYDWLEMSPFATALVRGDAAASVPTREFGRDFAADGSAVPGSVADDRLFYEMGYWGSAYSVTAGLAFDLAVTALNERGILGATAAWVLRNAMEPFVVGGDPSLLSGGIEANFLAGAAGQAALDPYRSQPTLELKDGGIAVNVPVIPFLRSERAVDVIVVVDMSSDVHVVGGDILDNRDGRVPAGFVDVKRAAVEAGLAGRFPGLEVDEPMPCRGMRVLRQTGCPTIVYIPVCAQKDGDFEPGNVLSTFSFSYSDDELLQYRALISGIINAAAATVHREYRGAPPSYLNGCNIL